MKKMKPKKICVYLCLSVVSLFLFPFFASAQTVSKNFAAQLLKRTAYKTETMDFGAGGTVSIAGAPVGSISIEGWRKNSVEVSADVEVQAANEKDLALLARINTFAIDEDFGHIRIQTVGAYDKDYLKRAGVKVSKELAAMPFKVDYRIKVPMFCDLEIDGGRGDFSLANVEGAIEIKFLESTNAKLDLIGGTISATFGGGNADITIPMSSWRGRSLDVQMASGAISVHFAPNLNANIDASVLRSGRIENLYEFLKPREPRLKFTDKKINAKSGGGGAMLSFTVGDGTLKLARIEN